MPTENELKYVLTNEPMVLQQIAKIAKKILSIEQAYIQSGSGWNFRIRKTFGVHYSEPIYHATYKHKINGRVVELQLMIDERDYFDLLSVASNILYKTRYVIPIGAFNWEVDFFYDYKHTAPYFVLAEIELPEKITKPPFIPSFIQENLLFAVPIDNNEYSSKKLSSIKYALKKYGELIRKEGLDHEEKL